ncbi:unnamed protein product [Owenia fusiformis]|uniref:Uncharacterized protein n=1 Tax=Owenia fusiformis TaxID=6347 RepID=A0A8S4PMH4_OWEFU|nr:unnamed protein product [Owenia fusiformis]
MPPTTFKVEPGLVDSSNPGPFITKPTQPTEKKPGQLTKEQVDHYFEQGHLLIDDFFNIEDDLEPARDAIRDRVEALAQKLYKAGKIKKLYSDYGLFQRLTMIEKEFPGANVLLHKQQDVPQAFRDLWGNQRLLNAVEQLVGPDIAASTVWNLRTKTPKNEATVVPWHQDSAYFDNQSYNCHVVTAWIPFLDANEANGCMQVARGGHKLGKVARHECCAGPTWYVMLDDETMSKTLNVDLENDIITCPVPYGGMLLINNMIPHRSLTNVSNDIRWSVDLRWQKVGSPDCLWGIKQPLTLRTAANPNMKPDWAAYEAEDRTEVQTTSMGVKMDEFDTTIAGPWMKKWELVHHNEHTKAWMEQNPDNWKLENN